MTKTKGNGSTGERKSARRNGGIPGKGTRPKSSNGRGNSTPRMTPAEKLMARNLPYAVLLRKLNNLGLHYNSAVASK